MRLNHTRIADTLMTTNLAERKLVCMHAFNETKWLPDGQEDRAGAFLWYGMAAIEVPSHL